MGLIGGGSGMFVNSFRDGTWLIHFTNEMRFFLVLYRAPLYQILTHALPDKKNKTKFTLIFSNVSEADILLRGELEAMAKEHSDKLKIIYYVDKGSQDWKGLRLL